MPKHKRESMTGRGSVGKVAIAGVKDRASNQVNARVVHTTDSETLQKFVTENANPGATVYTDDHSSYETLSFHHESVKHSIGEYVRGQAHTNGIESFWAMLKRVVLRHLPQDESRASEPLRQRVRWTAQRSTDGHCRSDGVDGSEDGRKDSALQGFGRRGLNYRLVRFVLGSRNLLHIASMTSWWTTVSSALSL